MANQILALEEAYSITVGARCKSSGAVYDKLMRIGAYLKAQIAEGMAAFSE